MQGSKTPLIVAAAAALVAAGLGGCTVHNYPAPPSPAEQQQQQQGQNQPQRVRPQAQAVQTAKPAAPPTPVAPTTRGANAAPAPAAQQQQQKLDSQTAAAGRSYTVKPGDNLWNISRDVYGDGTKYQRILDANPGLNPDNMKPGTKIVIP